MSELEYNAKEDGEGSYLAAIEAKRLRGDTHYPRKSFLICPVRGVDPSVSAGAVSRLEAEGWTVHWPPRDTDQTDPIGLQICEANTSAILHADAVHIIWDGKSQGCLFDLGVAFALGKRIIPLELPPGSEGKSFQNMVWAWAEYYA